MRNTILTTFAFAAFSALLAQSVSQQDKLKMYGKYSPCFVYQYVDLNDYSWLNLKKEILRHLRLALQIKSPF